MESILKHNTSIRSKMPVIMLTNNRYTGPSTPGVVMHRYAITATSEARNIDFGILSFEFTAIECISQAESKGNSIAISIIMMFAIM